MSGVRNAVFFFLDCWKFFQILQYYTIFFKYNMYISLYWLPGQQVTQGQGGQTVRQTPSSLQSKLCNM